MLLLIDLSTEDAVREVIGLTVSQQVFWQHLSEGGHVRSIHSHLLENRVVILQFKGKRKVKHDVGPVRRHVAIERRILVGIDHDERKSNMLFVLLSGRMRHRMRVALVVPLNEVSKANLLGQLILESLILSGKLGFGVLNVLAHGFHVLLGSRGESLPGDFLLLLGDNIHGHEDV